MEIRNTFIISALMHVTFAAALFLSAGFLGGSGRMLDEKVFYVNITKEIVSAYEKSAEKIEAAVPAAPETIVEEKKTVVEEEAVLVQAEIVHEEPAPVTVTEHSVVSKEFELMETVQPEASHDHAEAVYAAYTAPASVGAGITNDKAGGVLPPGVIALIGSAIEKAKTYPILARKRGIEGTVYVSFSINTEGEPQEVEVVKSSGYNILDKATLKVVHKAAPYPHIEDRIEVPITYRLKDI